MIKVILWDIDGTLLNFKEAEKVGVRKCFAEMGLGECTDEMLADYSRINDKYWQMLERGEMTKPEILVGRFTEFFEKYGIDTSKARLLNEMYQNCLGDVAVFNNNSKETVELLKNNGLIQCAVTNGTKVAQDKKLAISELDKLLDYFFISEVIGIEKPNIEFFDAVFEKVKGFRKDEILIVGDSLTSDMQGGVNAGIKTCWYNPDGKTNKSGNTLDYEIRDIGEVIGIVNESVMSVDARGETPIFTATTQYTFDKYSQFAKLIAVKENKFNQKILMMEICLGILAGLLYMTGSFLCISAAICIIVVPAMLKARQNKALVAVWNSTPAVHNLIYNYYFYDKHFHSENSVSSLDIEYDKIYRILESEYQFYIMIGKNQGLIIDKINCSAQLMEFLKEKMIAIDSKHNRG